MRVGVWSNACVDGPPPPTPRTAPMGYSATREFPADWVVRLGSALVVLTSDLPRYVLSYAPQHAARVEKRKVSHRPRPVLGFIHPYSKASLDACSRDMRVPVVDILDEQVHLIMLHEVRFVESLKQKARSPMPDVGEVRGGPRDLEAKRT